MTRAFLGLGSNIGDKVGYLRQAIALLEASSGIRIAGTSSFYRSEPVGKIDQDWFVNGAIMIETRLAPAALLRSCLEIETRLKRERHERWGPRTIDIDVLLFGDLELRSAEVQIPHPRLLERAFALRPLAELDPELEIGGVPIADWLTRVDDQKVERIS